MGTELERTVSTIKMDVAELVETQTGYVFEAASQLPSKVQLERTRLCPLQLAVAASRTFAASW